MAQLELVHPAPEADPTEPRADHAAIARMVSDGARVLDIGCGDGALMTLLARECGARVRGLELEAARAHGCVRRGLSVVQGDAERDLEAFPSGSVDYVILSRTLQCLDRPHAALRQAARIGERVIVSLANAGHWSARVRMLGGRLAQEHWGGELRHPCSIRDFAEIARGLRLTVERAVPLSKGAPGAPFAKTLWRANWFAEEAVFLLAP